MKTINILHLEDNTDDAFLIKNSLKDFGLNHNILWVDTKEKFETSLLSKEIDIVLADYTLPNYNGLTALAYTKEKRPGIPFILISGTIGEDKTIELFEADLTDFITKSNVQRLGPAIIRAFNESVEKKKRLIAEESLKKNEKLFRLFAENIKEVFWKMTPNLDQVLYVSPAYEEIWGRSVQSIYSNANEWMDPIIDADKENVKLYLAALRKHESAAIEYRITRPDGVIKIIYAKGFQVKDEQGKLINIIGVAADMTEFSQLKSQAHLNDKLTTIGTLAAGIAHEINNPIAWILGNLAYIKNNAATMDKFKLSELLHESIQGAERIRDIVSNLKGFARIDEQEIAALDLHDLINSVLSICAAEIKLHARVETNYFKNLPLIAGNSGKLHQVFLNLIMNAAQAIPVGDIENNLITIATTLDNNQVRIDVSDTGAGIPSGIMSKIFDPFFTTKPIGEGTGLGLSISYEIVKNAGGEIKVKSSPGKGTTFSVYLPLEKKIQVEYGKDSSKTAIAPIIKRKCILVVDDEPNLLKSMQRMLGGKHDITTACGGQAAITLLSERTKQYDLILTDLTMPGISGSDLYHFVAEKYPGLEDRFIFMTGGAYTDSIKEFINSVHNLRLNKPFEETELLQKIEKACNDRSNK